MQFSLIEVISITAVLQALLLAAASLFSGRSEKRSNILLVFLFLVFIILIVSSLTLTRNAPYPYMRLIMIGNQAALLVGPLIYLYLVSLMRDDFPLMRRDCFHFIPFFGFTLYLIFRLYIKREFVPWQSSLRIFCSSAFLIQSIFYFILIQKRISGSESVKNRLNHVMHSSGLQYLKLMHVGFIAIWLINMQAFVALDMWKRAGLCPYLYSIYFLILFLLINVLSLLLLRHPDILTRIVRYRSSRLTSNMKNRYRKTILSHFRNAKPYKDPSFCLRELSSQLSISSCYLSQTINESFHQNFREFINTYRIRESQRLLSNRFEKKINILEIAYEVGFNSKSAFNQAFKKNTGMTPREYRNRHSKKLE